MHWNGERKGILCADIILYRQHWQRPQTRERGPQCGVGVPALYHELAVHVSGAVGGPGQPIAGGDADDDHIVGHGFVGLGGRLQLAERL